MSNERQLWIVDDDPVFRMIFGMMLTKIDAGIECKECADGNDFLIKLKEAIESGYPLPKIIFLDLNMPDKSGWDVLEALNSFDSLKPGDIQIFVLSSSINPEDEQTAKSQRFCSGFLVKPITNKILKKILSSL